MFGNAGNPEMDLLREAVKRQFEIIGRLTGTIVSLQADMKALNRRLDALERSTKGIGIISSPVGYRPRLDYPRNTGSPEDPS